MKKLLNVLLVLVIIGLGWASYKSIEGPVSFDKTRQAREKEVIAQLINIRAAQVAYKAEHNVHAANFDELKNWLTNGSVKTVRRVMELTEEQLESGMTEQKAVAIVKRAMASGNWSEAESAGLSYLQDGARVSFTRDTITSNPIEAIFGADFDLSTFGYVPHSNNVMFEMDTASVVTGSGYDIKIFQANTPYATYLGDLNAGELANLIDKAEQTGKYPGLKVGSLTEINNNAGNWE